MGLINELKDSIKGKNLKIVYPEGEDVRILEAAVRHNEEGILTPILLGNTEKITELAKENNFNIENLEIIDPENCDISEFKEKFLERRKGKATEEQANKLLRDPNYFGTMMVYLDMVDGMVSGAAHATSDTIRPALQIIKTKPGTKIVSGAMVMNGPNDERYIFADIAINIELDAEQLADVAVSSAETAKSFGIDPKVAMLSFSTKGSASHPLQEKVAQATLIAKEKAPELVVDGELQFDAAIAPEVGNKKAPNSEVAGKANVFIFPDLQAGNIGYKIAQRLGGYEALGPILQGMAKPVNDLSRGCSAEDAYKLAIITASQKE